MCRSSYFSKNDLAKNMNIHPNTQPPITPQHPCFVMCSISSALSVTYMPSHTKLIDAAIIIPAAKVLERCSHTSCILPVKKNGIEPIPVDTAVIQANDHTSRIEISVVVVKVVRSDARRRSEKTYDLSEDL